ncbi:DNA-binding response regulator [Salimicrobium jeotgali]|uniref:DNA-binding response regulator n=1 Tax=Salimicrobium jeotgali TaxID=1230341 RepID=K2GD34_9BACI|nr:response regulator transcription factor [Salimicrobium jeotgali]AKG04183.1 DNA-binding response regulator [Salimicrobium jeotgali]EKE32147.1 two-component response regulator [Salimicrobium jeotgali]MBM7695758.1 two-component system competent response regulator ComA [Salimicrobium jeotgali]
MTNVLIVDDHPAVGMGTKAMIEQNSEMNVDVVENPGEVENIVLNKDYDVLLIDLYIPGMNGIELSKRVKQKRPDVTAIIYTGFDLSTHFNMLVEAEVEGFVSKTASQEQLLTAIRCAMRDEVVIPLHLFRQLRRTEASVSPVRINRTKEEEALFLNEKEQSILKEVSNGFTNKTIAQNLHMSQRSVEYTLTGIFNKLDVRSRTEALYKAHELGLISKAK